MSWIIKEDGFDPSRITPNGNKFLIGNGVFGYRGTLDEFTKNEKVAVNLCGVYDQVQKKWRESVNAFNPFYTKIKISGKELNPIDIKPIAHTQTLDIKKAIHKRQTTFLIDDVVVTIESERFASMDEKNLLGSKYTLSTNGDIEVDLDSGIDTDVWDINGPHIENIRTKYDDVIVASSNTQESKINLEVILKSNSNYNINYIFDNGSLKGKFKLLRDKPLIIEKIACININEHHTKVEEIRQFDYEIKLSNHIESFANLWDASDVKIFGDNEAQLALRYSIYHLLILTPNSDKASIPARGLSGQVYKGAIFWDTEIFMLPFYLNTNQVAAKKLISYRVNTLDGAKAKANEFGYDGAFYAWESHEGGIDACSLFNVTDVFTDRPVRTYFKDKQIHISGDVVYGIWNTYKRINDINILKDSLEVLLEVSRFFLSYMYFNPSKGRYEVLDVVGPDEYHERVNNNAFTNTLVKDSIESTLKAISIIGDSDESFLEDFITKNNYKELLNSLNEVVQKIFIKEPNENKVIEQFDRYFSLEDASVEEVKSRLKHQNEYWGTSSGVAFPTQIIKQADVVTMLYMFKEKYSIEILKANWKYYQGRTEHGSSLSASMYALVACLIDDPDYAYPFFMKSAMVDIIGKSKEYAGGIYIGGTHPAASGGAYMTAIYGFAGLRITEDKIELDTKLPSNIDGMEFKIIHKDKQYLIKVDKNKHKIEEV
jgi:trehalose/maltose hydrolase-like predicted phosphorylase